MILEKRFRVSVWVLLKKVLRKWQPKEWAMWQPKFLLLLEPRRLDLRKACLKPVRWGHLAAHCLAALARLAGHNHQAKSLILEKRFRVSVWVLLKKVLRKWQPKEWAMWQPKFLLLLEPRRLDLRKACLKPVRWGHLAAHCLAALARLAGHNHQAKSLILEKRFRVSVWVLLKKVLRKWQPKEWAMWQPKFLLLLEPRRLDLRKACLKPVRWGHLAAHCLAALARLAGHNHQAKSSLTRLL